MGSVLDTGASNSSTVLSCPERDYGGEYNPSGWSAHWITGLHLHSIARLLPDTRRTARWCSACSRASAPPRWRLWSAVQARSSGGRCAARRQSWGSCRWRSAWLLRWAAAGRSAGPHGQECPLTQSRKTAQESSKSQYTHQSNVIGQIVYFVNPATKVLNAWGSQWPWFRFQRWLTVIFAYSTTISMLLLDIILEDSVLKT